MNLNHYILKDEKIKKVDLMTWAKWFESSPDRIVSRDVVGYVRISTVFLGLDHNFGSKGKPILFETMMFSTKNDGKPLKEHKQLKLEALRNYQVRYRTLKEAKAGHKYAVNFAKSILKK